MTMERDIKIITDHMDRAPHDTALVLHDSASAGCALALLILRYHADLMQMSDIAGLVSDVRATGARCAGLIDEVASLLDIEYQDYVDRDLGRPKEGTP